MEIIKSNLTIIVSPEMRDYNIGQMRELYALAGYVSIQATSGFTMDPASDDDEVYGMIGMRR